MSNQKSLFLRVPVELLKKIKKKVQPTFIQPMLATLTKDYFSSNDWYYEHKYDGVRCIAVKKNKHVRLMSRNDKLMNNEYPELVTALEKQRADNFIIDGEIIARNKKGISDFQLLQGRINIKSLPAIAAKQKNVPIFYCIFDLMYCNGYDIQALPLYSRKDILKKLFTFNKTLIYSEHTIGNGVTLFKKACKLGWEGIMAKRKESHYVNARSREWLKFKCSIGQELIIVGYTEPRGSRRYFGALLVGYYQKGVLRYAGKVGTGFTQETLELLGKKLHKLTLQKKPTLEGYDVSLLGVHWVKPILVAEFEFAQWTQGGKLRVGRYKGLRNDKAAKDVVKEVPK